MSSNSKQSRREQTHERILDAAARAVCREGYAGVAVANVMKEAGLTHGGFYAHFESRDALLAEAVAHAGARSIASLKERIAQRIAQDVPPLRALIEEYLSETHLRKLEQGCPVAALVSDMQRAAPALREVSALRVLEVVKLVEAYQPAGSAMLIASTMIGAMQIARVLGDSQDDSVLRDCREALLAQFGGAAEH